MTAFVAPGRVNLIGEQTDHAGGLCLPAAIDRAIEIEVRRSSDRIVLRSEDRVPISVAADGGEPTEGWARFPAAVAAELGRLGRAPVGIEATITSDLPEGAGLSSSAALAIVIAKALCDAADLDLDPREMALACSRAEGRAVGVHCGVMDHIASLRGLKGHAVLLNAASLEIEYVSLPTHLRLVVLHSGVRRRLEDSSYDRRVTELRRALAGSDDPVDLRRLRHLQSENRRVADVVEALGADPPALDRIGAALVAGHESLRDDFEVSTTELDALVDLAMAHGAIGARLTGAGFGGAVVALAEAADAEAMGSATIGAYRSAFPPPQRFLAGL